jgi:predicted transcriptional regulator
VSIFVNMVATNIKEEPKRLLEKLPDNRTWDDLMHEIHVQQSIEAGLADSEAGKVVEVSEVRKQFGLS